MKIYTLAALALLAVSSTAMAASEEPVLFANGELTKLVRVDSHDLHDEQRAAGLYGRLEKAAAEVCQVDGDAPASVLAEDRDCVDRAMNGAIADLGSDALRRVHAGSGHARAYAGRDR